MLDSSTCINSSLQDHIGANSYEHPSDSGNADNFYLYLFSSLAPKPSYNKAESISFLFILLPSVFPRFLFDFLAEPIIKFLTASSCDPSNNSCCAVHASLSSITKANYHRRAVDIVQDTP